MGPVPTPEPGTTRAQWVDQLIEWHGEAERWGWHERDGAELWKTRFAELKTDPSDTRITDFLAAVEEDHKAGRLLQETYALWRHNLEHLLTLPRE